MPDKAPMAAASVKVRLPDILVLMPTSLAPRRLTAVARRARPYKVLPKKTQSPTMSAAQVPSTKKVCADQLTAPICTSPSMKGGVRQPSAPKNNRSEEHTYELQSLMRISYAVFCLKKKTQNTTHTKQSTTHYT